MERGDWRCSCGSVNFKHRTECRGCGKQKTKGQFSFVKVPSVSSSNNASSQNQSHVPTHRPGDKICPKCSDLNFASRTNCRKCGQNLSSEDLSSQNFSPRDLSSNELKANSDGDNHKSESKQSRPMEIQIRPGDWICPNDECKEHNFKIRDICRKCNTVKPGISRPSTGKRSTSSSSSSSSTSTQEKDDSCVICMNAQKSFAIRVCGHLCLCGACGYALDKCPICRESFNPDTDIIRIFNC